MTLTKTRKRVLSGMRSTGKLHLGNYVGALQNWVGMQDSYECFFCVADWHALTTDYADTSKVKENSLEVALDWLAAKDRVTESSVKRETLWRLSDNGQDMLKGINAAYRKRRGRILSRIERRY